MWDLRNDLSGLAVKTLLLVALAIIAVLLWLRYSEVTPPVYIPGPTSIQKIYVPKKVTKIERELVPINAKMEYFKKEEVQKALKDQNVPDNVIAMGEVPAHTGPTTVISHTTLQGETMRGSLSFRQEPPPFFQLKREIVTNARFLYAGKNWMEVDAEIHPLRIGPVDTVIGGGIEVRRDDDTVGGRGYVGLSAKW